MSEGSDSIKVVVPAPWRLMGQIFCGLGVLSFIGFFWRIFFWPEPPADDVVAVSVICFFSVPAVCCFFMPVFTGGYPGWFVRVVGARRLEKFIADCRLHADPKRAERATLSDPGSWIRDQRTFWIVMIAGCAVLGVINALM